MYGRSNHLLALSIMAVLLLVALICEAQTIRSQRELRLLDGMTGVITYIGGTRVTISFQDPDESLTVHVRDAGDLRVGDFVKMEGGRPVKTDAPAKAAASVEPPEQAGTQKAEEPPPATPPPKADPGPSEPAKPSPNAQK